MRLRVHLIIMCLWKFAEPASAETYRLNRGERVTAIINGKSLPSCGQAAATVLKSYAVVHVEYDGRKVSVNKEPWQLSKTGGRPVAQTMRTEPIAYLLSVVFSKSGNTSSGRLVFLRLDSDRKPTCHDEFALTGTHEP